jgi:hypothetical protein
MARPSNKIAPAAKKPAARPAAKKPAARPAAKKPAARPQSDSVQQARKDSAAIAKAATPNAREGRTPPKPKSTQGAQTPATRALQARANMYLEAGPEYRGAGQNFYQPPPYIAPKDKKPKPVTDSGPGPGSVETPTPPVVTPVPPVQGGLAASRNIRPQYLEKIRELTANLLKNADSFLFAYNFKTIERMVSYALETDDQSQRQSQIVSNIKRSFSGVPLTELQIRDRLNAVINQISQEIGDLTPATTKLTKFGIKKDNDAFKGGTPRIQNGIAVYDLELKLPSLEGFNYSVTYRIKCFDID